MKNGQQRINSNQFVTRLGELGIDINAEKLRRWSNKKLIPPYQTRYQPKRKKRGRPPNPIKAKKEGKVIEEARLGRVSEWPEDALWEAAAVWAVDNVAKILAARGEIKRKTLSTEMILGIRNIAKKVAATPEATYELKKGVEVIGPAPLVVLDYQLLQMKTAEDRNIDVLVKTWIAARVKARNNEVVRYPMKAIFPWYSTNDATAPYALNTPYLESVDKDFDELVFLVDGNDFRKSVMYRPFDDIELS